MLQVRVLVVRACACACVPARYARIFNMPLYIIVLPPCFRLTRPLLALPSWHTHMCVRASRTATQIEALINLSVSPSLTAT